MLYVLFIMRLLSITLFVISTKVFLVIYVNNVYLQPFFTLIWVA